MANEAFLDHVADELRVPCPPGEGAFPSLAGCARDV